MKTIPGEIVSFVKQWREQDRLARIFSILPLEYRIRKLRFPNDDLLFASISTTVSREIKKVMLIDNLIELRDHQLVIEKNMGIFICQHEISLLKPHRDLLSVYILKFHEILNAIDVRRNEILDIDEQKIKKKSTNEIQTNEENVTFKDVIKPDFIDEISEYVKKDLKTVGKDIPSTRILRLIFVLIELRLIRKDLIVDYYSQENFPLLVDIFKIKFKNYCRNIHTTSISKAVDRNHMYDKIKTDISLIISTKK